MGTFLVHVAINMKTVPNRYAVHCTDGLKYKIGDKICIYGYKDEELESVDVCELCSGPWIGYYSSWTSSSLQPLSRCTTDGTFCYTHRYTVNKMCTTSISGTALVRPSTRKNKDDHR